MRVQLRLAFAPVVFRRPVACELLGRRERHALRCVRDRLFFGPAGRLDASAEVDELLLGEVDAERTNGLLHRGLTWRSGPCGLSPAQRTELGGSEGRCPGAEKAA